MRKFGYLQRLIALEFRAKRCADSWASHQRRCRNFIVKASELCEKQNLAVVVGSGLLLEVPINTLSECFDRVILVDMFHMPQVRREAKRFFNVKLLTGDITGIFQAMKEHRPPGPNIPTPPPRLPNLKNADLIVSCNCLNQLAGPFTDYFEKTRGFLDLDSDKVAYHVMENHAKALANEAGGVAVLITDHERFAMQGDKVVSRSDLLKALRLPPSPMMGHNEEWEWFIAPHPEEHPTHDYVHTVSARIYKHGAVALGKEGEGGESVPLPPELEAELIVEKGDPLADVIPER